LVDISLLAMPWIRLLVTGFPQQRPKFFRRALGVEFVVDKVAVGQLYVR